MKTLIKWLKVAAIVIGVPLTFIGTAILILTGLNLITPINLSIFGSKYVDDEQVVTDTPLVEEEPTIPFIVPRIVPAPKAAPRRPSIWTRHPVLVLEKKNTLTFRNVITDKSVSAFNKKAIEMSKKLSKRRPIFLFLDTPGGSVDAGELALDTLHGLPQEVKTITHEAASMGFHWVQNLGERLVLPSGRLMSHRMYVYGLQGQVPGEAVTRLNTMIDDAKAMSIRIANRLGITVEEYEKKIQDEYWVRGQAAVVDGTADKVVLIRCGNSLRGTTKDEIEFFFGITIPVEWSNCPLINFPVKIGKPKMTLIDDDDDDDIDKELNKAALAFVNMLIYNKPEFIKTFITNGKLLNVQ